MMSTLGEICMCLPLSTLARARGSQLCRQLLLQSLKSLGVQWQV